MVRIVVMVFCKRSIANSVMMPITTMAIFALPSAPLSQQDQAVVEVAVVAAAAVVEPKSLEILRLVSQGLRIQIKP